MFWQVDLYTVCNAVIKPSTKESQLSFVEMISVGEMVPDYFVSHVSSQSALVRLPLTD